jgi:hypothetical protein
MKKHKKTALTKSRLEKYYFLPDSSGLQPRTGDMV